MPELEGENVSPDVDAVDLSFEDLGVLRASIKLLFPKSKTGLALDVMSLDEGWLRE